MNEIEIHDYAKRLYDAHGDKAEAEAAQKIKSCESAGDAHQAENWRRIRAAIAAMRGPHSA